MTAVNEYSHHYIKSIEDGTPKKFYKNLLQVNSAHHIKIIELDS